MTGTTTILWRRLDRPGHEAARVRDNGGAGHVVEGAAVLADDGRSCRLDYSIACDATWRTVSARVTGWVGDRAVALDIEVDDSRRWAVNGTMHTEVQGCVDVDLGFSPSTNLLPIRRMRLAVGQRASIRAAWVRFPACVVEPLDQVYERVGDSTYRYESATGFSALLDVNDAGFVTSYPGVWEAIAW